MLVVSRDELPDNTGASISFSVTLKQMLCIKTLVYLHNPGSQSMSEMSHQTTYCTGVKQEYVLIQIMLCHRESYKRGR